MVKLPFVEGQGRTSTFVAVNVIVGQLVAQDRDKESAGGVPVHPDGLEVNDLV
jgi:hypothetical protein